MDRLSNALGIQTTTNSEEAVTAADVVIMGVKPQVMESVLRPLQKVLQNKKPLVISVAAGLNLHSLSTWVGGN